MSRYLNPYTDFGFKKLFGEEANKDLLLDFLNQLLPENHQIAELNFRNTEQLPDKLLRGEAILDANCFNKTGERFTVKMKIAKIHFLKDRSLFYDSFLIRDQASKGELDFKSAPIYFIAIIDFICDETEDKRKFLRDMGIRGQKGYPCCDNLHFKFLQMPLFNKTENELETRFDKWVYFLKNLENFDHIPAILNEPIFHKAFAIAELANLTREQYNAYEQNLIDYWGTKAAVDTARDEGKRQGREEGRKEGLKEGRDEGARQTWIKTARSMVAKGFDDDVVIKLSRISAEELAALKNNQNG